MLVLITLSRLNTNVIYYFGTHETYISTKPDHYDAADSRNANGNHFDQSRLCDICCTAKDSSLHAEICGESKVLAPQS